MDFQIGIASPSLPKWLDNACVRLVMVLGIRLAAVCHYIVVVVVSIWNICTNSIMVLLMHSKTLWAVFESDVIASESVTITAKNQLRGLH